MPLCCSRSSSNKSSKKTQAVSILLNLEIILGIFWFLPQFTAVEAFKQNAMYLLYFAIWNCEHIICNDICQLHDISTWFVMIFVICRTSPLMICNDILSYTGHLHSWFVMIFCYMQDISTRMAVRMVPTIIFTREGKEVGRIKSIVSIEHLQEKITSLLQPQMTWVTSFHGLAPRKKNWFEKLFPRYDWVKLVLRTLA